MIKYFSADYLKYKFQLFSLSHIIALVVIAFANIVMVLWLKKVKSDKIKKYFCYGLSILLLGQELSLNLWYIYIGQWSIGQHLPLHLCGLAIVLSPIMLIQKNYTLYELIYFWGLGGAIQALITPDNVYAFPHYRFFQFFTSHASIILASIYMTFIEGFRPRFSSLIKTIIITNIYMGFIALFNLLVNGNYLFICHPPDTPSIIDLLGPWPWYILSLEIVGIISLFVYYSPFLIKDFLVKPKSIEKLRNKLNP